MNQFNHFSPDLQNMIIAKIVDDVMMRMFGAGAKTSLTQKELKPEYAEPNVFRGEEISLLDPKEILKAGGLHPGLASRVELLLDEAWRNGLRVQLFSGHRSFSEQEVLYKRVPRVTFARPGQSFHNFGLAVDFVFIDSENRPSWSQKYDWAQLGVIGKRLGLKWGGDFKRIKDMGHFQLPIEKNLKQLNKEYGLDQLDWLR